MGMYIASQNVMYRKTVTDFIYKHASWTTTTAGRWGKDIGRRLAKHIVIIYIACRGKLKCARFEAKVD